MKYKNTAFVICCILALLTEKGRCQLPSVTKGVEFRTLGLGGTTTNLVYVDGKEFKPVGFDSQNPSSFYLCTNPVSPLQIGRTIKDEKGGVAFVEMAKVDISNAGRQFLLIFKKRVSGNDLWDVFFYPDNPNDISSGAYRVVNFFTAPIVLLMGDQKVMMNPGTAQVITPSPNKGSSVFKVQLFKTSSGDTHPAFSTVCSVDPSTRNTLLIIPSSDSLSGVGVVRFSDNIQAMTARLNPAPPASGQHP